MFIPDTGTVKGEKAAFKFSHYSKKVEIDQEFKIYAILNAVNNPSVVSYGIPAVLYRGISPDGYHMLGITLLGQSLQKMFNLKYGILEPITILLIFQKLIRTLKYIHGCGVVHNDIKPDNILLHDTELFIIGKLMCNRLFDYDFFFL